jgi:hypothetical protein
VDITAGGDSLGLCDQKSSNKHVSDFGLLRSYWHFLIPVQAVVPTHHLTGDVSASWLIVRVASILFAT